MSRLVLLNLCISSAVYTDAIKHIGRWVKMKVQLLAYDGASCPVKESADLVVHEFQKGEAFDAFDLTVISLQDKKMWHSHGSKPFNLDNAADIDSLSRMIGASKKSNCLILLPGNVVFPYNYGYRGHGGDKGYLNGILLKDCFDDFSKSQARVLFSSPLGVCFGVTKTGVSGRELTADFSFSEPLCYPNKGLLRSNASTLTAVALSDRLVASTLQIECTEDFVALLDVLYPSANQPASLPEWLDDIEFLDEVEQKSCISSLDAEIARLKREREEREERLSEYRKIKSILCSKDFELEGEVRRIIADFTGSDGEFVDEKEEDFRFERGKTIFLVEIKGSLGGLKRQHVSKTYDHVQIELDNFEAQGKAGNVKGVLVFASQINVNPEMRDRFPDKQLSIAKRNEIVVLSTEALLKCYEAFLEGRLSSESFIDVLEKSSGWMGLESFGLK